MKKKYHRNRLLLIGVDCHEPQNEMAGNLIALLQKKVMSVNFQNRPHNISVISLEIAKPNYPNSEEIIIQPSVLGKPFQLISLFNKIIAFSSENSIIHFFGNGNQALIFFFYILNKFFGFPVVYSYLSSIKYKYMPKNIVFVATDTNRYNNKKNYRYVIPPASRFEYHPNTSKKLRTIAFASVPKKETDFKKAGVFLIKEAAQLQPKIKFHILNRFNYLSTILMDIFQNSPNVIVEDGIIEDIKLAFMRYDAFLAPSVDRGRAEIPLSLIEAISLGKPILVSDLIGLNNYTIKYKCGAVFSPEPFSLSQAIDLVKKKYLSFSKNTYNLHNKEFSQFKFVNSYIKIYDKL